MNELQSHLTAKSEAIAAPAEAVKDIDANGHSNQASDAKGSARLCIDSVAETWGQAHHAAPDEYKKFYAEKLGKANAGEKELNLAWENHLLDFGQKKGGAEEATRIMQAWKKAENCE